MYFLTAYRCYLYISTFMHTWRNFLGAEEIEKEKGRSKPVTSPSQPCLLKCLLQPEKIAAMEKQYRNGMSKGQTENECSLPHKGLGPQGKTPQGRDLQPERGGAKRGASRLQPFQSHGSIAFTCAPRADRVFPPGAQTVVQAVTQQFPYSGFLGSHISFHWRTT